MRQFSKARRRLAAGAFLVVAGPVALGSVAYACQSLTTLHANPSTAAAGQTIALFGKNYSSNATSTNIQIRMNTRDGQIIGEFSPRSVLDNVPVTIPANTAAGVHTLLATQYTSAGNAVSGSPGRTTVTITAAARTANEGSAASAAAPSSEPVAATPAAAAAAAPAAAASAPAASNAAASVATGSPAAPVAAAPAQTAAAAAPAPAVAVASDPAATNVVATPAGPAAAAPDASLVTVGGLLPASSSSSSILPGLTLGAGLALVLLSLGAFIKSSRSGRGTLAS